MNTQLLHYYARRAQEYEQIYAKPERQADLDRVRRALTEFAAQINRVLFLESQLLHGAPELLCTLSTVAIEGGMLYGLNPDSNGVVWWDRWSQHNANSVVLARSGAGKSYFVIGVATTGYLAVAAWYGWATARWSQAHTPVLESVH